MVFVELVIGVIVGIWGWKYGKKIGYSWAPYLGAALGFLFGLAGMLATFLALNWTSRGKALRAEKAAQKTPAQPEQKAAHSH